ncbi:hypothetical protein SLEP1_g6796 [Rubroshorea leprosula]|uniref:Uncharacterized protein n=1 Tax=Rubroshorea leprosula TaxID=152421 RepID=A0AAV5I281_9ROSI|nr:hypothetical protein SLEP1_g6796 [Rubroshorea leprosula]
MWIRYRLPDTSGHVLVVDNCWAPVACPALATGCCWCHARALQCYQVVHWGIPHIRSSSANTTVQS